MEVSIVQMLRFWEMYRAEHRKQSNSAIGEEPVLGPWWSSIGTSILGLLHGEKGSLDFGTLDSFIIETMRENGVPVEDVEGARRLSLSSERSPEVPRKV